jgi:hypothetical protein
MYEAYFNFSAAKKDEGKRKYSAEGNLEEISDAIYSEFPTLTANWIDMIIRQDDFMNLTCAFEDVSVEIYRRDDE